MKNGWWRGKGFRLLREYTSCAAPLWAFVWAGERRSRFGGRRGLLLLLLAVLDVVRERLVPRELLQGVLVHLDRLGVVLGLGVGLGPRVPGGQQVVGEVLVAGVAGEGLGVDVYRRLVVGGLDQVVGDDVVDVVGEVVDGLGI